MLWFTSAGECDKVKEKDLEVPEMKIGVSSYSFMKHIRATGCGYKDICDIAKKIGYDGIEFVNLHQDCIPGTEDEFAVAKEIREYCEKIGLEIMAYTVGANFLAEDMEAEMAKVRHCVDVAAALGAPVMRHDVCYSLRDQRRYTWREAAEEIAPYVREITRYAASKGVVTCSENHGYIFQDAQRVEHLIRLVDDKNYGWLVGMGNFICTDGNILDSVRIAAPYAVHVHAKDFLWKSGAGTKPEGWGESTSGNYWRGTVVGHGVIPIAQCVKVLKNGGYDGYLSLEFEGWEDNLQALESGYTYLKSIV